MDIVAPPSQGLRIIHAEPHQFTFESAIRAAGIKHSMSDALFDATLAKSIDEIYRALTVKFDAWLLQAGRKV
jgi:hypothetical protein